MVWEGLRIYAGRGGCGTVRCGASSGPVRDSHRSGSCPERVWSGFGSRATRTGHVRPVPVGERSCAQRPDRRGGAQGDGNRARRPEIEGARRPEIEGARRPEIEGARRARRLEIERGYGTRPGRVRTVLVESKGRGGGGARRVTRRQSKKNKKNKKNKKRIHFSSFSSTRCAPPRSLALSHSRPLTGTPAPGARPAPAARRPSPACSPA